MQVSPSPPSVYADPSLNKPAMKAPSPTQPLPSVTFSGWGKRDALPRPDAARLQSHVERLVTYPRYFDNPAGLNAAADYIRDEWEAMGLSVREQSYEVFGKTYKNLIVSLNPTAKQRLIVGAHYDVCAYEPREPMVNLIHSEKGYARFVEPGFFNMNPNAPGADDNASGVAGLLELSRLLSKNPQALKTGLDLVAFTLEEPPVFNSNNMGSRVHAQSVKDQQPDIPGMIALDMIGYYDEARGSQKYPHEKWKGLLLRLLYGPRANFVNVVGTLDSLSWVRTVQKALKKQSPKPVHKMVAPASVKGLQLSDHKNYDELGIPAALISNTGPYRNPGYHHRLDTPDTLNYGRMADVVQGLYGLVTSKKG